MREQRRQVVRVNLENGLTYRQIGQALGISAATVMRDFNVMKADWRKEHVHQIHDMISMEAARLDVILQAIMPQVRAKKPDHGAIELVLKTLDRRLKLYGLDAAALLDQLKTLLEPTDAEQVGTETRRIADGLRSLEAIVERYRGGPVQDDPDGSNGGGRPLN